MDFGLKNQTIYDVYNAKLINKTALWKNLLTQCLIQHHYLVAGDRAVELMY